MSHDMISEDLIIVNRLGLHARAAAKFVRKALQYQAEVFLVKDGQKSDGKSIMSILMLAAEKGSTVTLTVSGQDHQKAFADLKGLIECGFEELAEEK